MEGPGRPGMNDGRPEEDARRVVTCGRMMEKSKVWSHPASEAEAPPCHHPPLRPPGSTG